MDVLKDRKARHRMPELHSVHDLGPRDQINLAKMKIKTPKQGVNSEEDLPEWLRWLKELYMAGDADSVFF
ncbi:hypothetical protein MYX75_03860 [Acidobacteria bacterium AH-259-A15]|nr:hypothetical protein [Acidobacteria bacterium AH-259-A15]